MTLAPLPALMIEPAVRAALAEDLGRAGDIFVLRLWPGQHELLELVARASPRPRFARQLRDRRHRQRLQVDPVETRFGIWRGIRLDCWSG